MDIKDQVAIHEAMEQQTISISKAGVQATLNARASILAAANPIGGRYDRSKTLRNNVDMTPAIMSRFDLFFVVLDECVEALDYHVARHIVGLHQNKEQASDPEYTTEQVQRYIKFARTLKPMISPAARTLLANSYRQLRQWDSTQANKSSYRITVRQLEAMVRLSEAIARLQCSDEVTCQHVAEARRLLQKSIVTVEKGSLDMDIEPELDLEEEVFAAESQNAAEAEKQGMDEDAAGPEGAEGEAEEGGTEEGEVPAEEAEAPGAEEEAPAAAEEGPQQRQQQQAGKTAKEAKPVVAITFEKYTQISQMIVIHLRAREANFAGNLEDAGLKRSQIVDWYLGEQTELKGEEELKAEARLVRSVLKNLKDKDNVLIEVSQEENPRDRKLAVHPNYDHE